MFYEMIDALTRQTASGYVASTTSTTVVAVVAPPGMPNSIAPPPGASTGLTVVMANACVEGFMVHLRNLIDFMWPTMIHDTDVVAEDFCTTGTWKRPITKCLVMPEHEFTRNSRISRRTGFQVRRSASSGPTA